MNRFPCASAASPPVSNKKVLFKVAVVAGPPSPEKPVDPLPATVVMIPFRPTLRMRPQAAKKMFPAGSTAIACAKHNEALVAGPPSPEKPGMPLPATTVRIPSTETFITWRCCSSVK